MTTDATTDQAEPRGRAIEFRLNRDWFPIILVLALGLLVRLWAMRWPPFPNDMAAYIGWGERMREVGPWNFYAENVFADYAPGYIYVFWLTSILQHAFFEGASVTVVHFLYRFPPVLCDLATTALIYLFVLRTYRARVDDPDDSASIWAGLAAACYAFNPAIIFNAAAWGQTDSVFTLLMVLSLLLVFWGRPEWSVVSYTLAFLVKPQAISFAPVLVVALLLLFPLRRVLIAAGIGLALGVVMLLPFFGLGLILEFIEVMRDATDTYPYTSLYSYNLWGIYGFWRDDAATVFLGMSARTVGFILYAVGVIGGVVWLVAALRRTADRPFTLLMFAVYFTFLPVMVLTRMHERYLHPVLPFLLLFASLCQVKSIGRDPEDRALRYVMAPFVLYVALAVLHMVNLYQVYEFYQYFPHPVPPENRTFHRIFDSMKVWSVLTLLCFSTFVVLMPSWLPRLVSPVFDRWRADLTPRPPSLAGKGVPERSDAG
jgi:Gpi18-like mannosyltransferase